MRRMVLIATLAALLPLAPARAETPVVRLTEVCFTVHNLGDPTPQQISGTLFHTNYDSDSTALLLLHGAVTDRTAWDGAWPSVQGAPSTARQLAQAGYAVFAIDRLGYSRSLYSGDGRTLTAASYVEQTHEMVTQLRSGTYRFTEETCAGGAGVLAGIAPSKVVLGGFSSGAGITERYATRYHDIDGIVALMWSNQGFSNRFTDNFRTTILPQVLAGQQYVHFFEAQPDGYGYSVSCEEILFYVPGMNPDSLKQLCGPEHYGDESARNTPVGEGSIIASMAETRASIGLVGPTPALLVFADHDAVFTNAESGGGEPDLTTPEIEMWRDGCNCDVSFHFQANAGHVGWWHDTAPGMVDGVIDWLRSRGL